MDWSTSALMNKSPLARRLPGQRTPPDPTLAQPNAADLTYGWHASNNGSSSSSESHSESDDEATTAAEGSTRQQEAALALRQRRRERRAARVRRASDSDLASSSEGSILSFNSATAATVEENIGGSNPTKEGGPVAPINGPPPDPNHDSESFICRICFDGSGSQDEGGETLGRLIAPCRCRGTMKFVHQACLTRWRATSMRASSFMACDQCGSPYKFRKSKFVGLATNRLLIIAVSCLLFITLIWSVGYAAETVVQRWDNSDNPAQGKASSKGGYWQSLFGDDEDGPSGSLYDDDSDVYNYGYGYVSTFYWEPLSYFRLIKAAVKHVGSGRATRAVKDLVKGEPDSAATGQKHEEKEMGWFKTLLDDWKYGSGGLWEGQRPETDGEDLDETPKGEAKRRERYDAQTATELKAGEEPRRGSANSKNDQLPFTEAGWWDRITMQFSLGFSLVGIFSFLNLLLGVSLWGPFQLGNFGLGHSFARLTGGGRRRGGGGGGGGDGGTVASVVLLFLVIIGVLRALMAVISFTTYLSKRLLTRVEDYIVEYSGEEMDQAAQNDRPQVHQAAQRQWWRR